MKDQKVSFWHICWDILMPILLYLGVTIVVSLIGGIVIGIFATQDILSMNLVDEYDMYDAVYDMLLKYTLQFAVLLQAISAIITIPILNMFYKKDWRRRTYRVDHKSVAQYKKIYIVLAGAAACISFNLILSIPWIYKLLGQGYDSVAESLYGGSIIIQLIGIGIIIPICEEYVFRGMIYMRLRDHMPTKWAIVVSAAVFGVYHGNLLQGIYAFLLGALMAYVMEKYKSVVAPSLFHITANLVSLGLNEVYLYSDLVIVLLIAICLVVLGVSLYLINKNVNPKLESIESEHNVYSYDDYSNTHSVDDYYPNTHSVDDYYPKIHDVDDDDFNR